MKILMIGLGSIGQRHVRNLRSVLGNAVEILAYRSRGLSRTFTDKLEIREGVDLETEYGIQSYTELSEALAQKPEIAFITNITAKHKECAIAAAEAGCHLFIEKPLSHDLEGVSRLRDMVRDKKLSVFMGFQNRYHPCVQELKSIYEKGMLGENVYARTEFSERVRTMHRYEDYRQTYMAQKSMGGGPVLNLQMHDLDLIQWIFGMPHSVTATRKENSSLEIDVEESADALFICGNERNTFTVAAHTDFLQYPPVHRITLVGSGGRAEADLLHATVRLWIEDEKVCVKDFSDFQRNDMFIQELKDFLQEIEAVKDGKAGGSTITLEDGINSLRMAEGIRRAAAEHREIRMEEIRI